MGLQGINLTNEEVVKIVKGYEAEASMKELESTTGCSETAIRDIISEYEDGLIGEYGQRFKYRTTVEGGNISVVKHRIQRIPEGDI